MAFIVDSSINLGMGGLEPEIGAGGLVLMLIVAGGLMYFLFK